MSLKYLGNVKLVVTVFANFSYLFMFLAWHCEYTCTCIYVHMQDGVSHCSALQLCMCWME